MSIKDDMQFQYLLFLWSFMEVAEEHFISSNVQDRLGSYPGPCPIRVLPPNLSIIGGFVCALPRHT